MDSFESNADLCVLGGGIAGMLVAERALSLGRRVLLVERGTPLTAQQRLARRSHDDPLPFNRSPHRLPHESPPVGPRIRWDRDYPYWPVYNLGGCTNHFFGNMPRFHPSHFDAPAFAGGIARTWPLTYADLERYYLDAERRLDVAGSATRTPFTGEVRLSPAAASAVSVRPCVPDPVWRGLGPRSAQRPPVARRRQPAAVLRQQPMQSLSD